MRRDVAWAGVALALLVAMGWLGGLGVPQLAVWWVTHSDSMAVATIGAGGAIGAAIVSEILGDIAVVYGFWVAVGVGLGIFGAVVLVG